MEEKDLLSVSDFLIVLIKGKWLLIGAWLLIMSAVVGYLLLVKKTYRLQGTIYVGRFQEILLEEGEFVAHKLEDYSFIKRALDRAGLDLDISVTRLQKMIRTDLLNEIKKIKDVGLVQLTVDYKDRKLVLEIFKALSDQLIAEHLQLLDNSRNVFKEMERLFWESEGALRETLTKDEGFAYEAQPNLVREQTVPANLLLRHTISEKQEFWRQLIKDIHYIKIESDSATKSYNTKLAAEPEIPDEPFKPKTLLTLVLGAVIATVFATLVTFAWFLFNTQVRPKLRKI